MEYAIFFENGAWLVMRQELGGSSIIATVPTLELALMEASFFTNAPVGIKLITKD